MAKYEVVLVKYPNADYPDNLWWTVVCLAMRGCVSDGQTREEALMMIADAMALYLEPEPGWEVPLLDEEQTQVEKETSLAEYHAAGGITEIHWVEPRFMTEEEMRSNPRFADLYDPTRSGDAPIFPQPERGGSAVRLSSLGFPAWGKRTVVAQ